MATTSTRVIDPVCGMEIDPETAAGHSRWQGRDFHFCSASCKRKFDANPGSYAEADAPHEAPHDAPTDAPAAATAGSCCAHGDHGHGAKHHQGHAHGAGAPTAPAKPADTDAIYTCPMHPEIRQKGPGACPICG